MNPFVIIVGVNPAELANARELGEAYQDVGGPKPETDITVYWQPEGEYELRPLIQEGAEISRDDAFIYMETILSARGGQEVARIEWSKKR